MDDIRSFIDGASYKLSALGADGTISIKSGFISNLSVRTPRSAVSVQQSLSSFKKDSWSQYRAKSKRTTATDGDDIFKAGPTAAPADNAYHSEVTAGASPGKASTRLSLRSHRPPPSHCDQPNLALKAGRGASSDYAPSVTSSTLQSKMPYPFLSSLLDSLDATQRSKRVLFENEPRSEILKHITKQMKERQ